jgi:5-hydroxyisourate hydrolase-like protein (transthyretin family)
MKVLFTSLFAFIIFSATAQQIPNAGFESWGTGNFSPSGWVAAGFFPTIVKSTDAHSGNYAMKLHVATYFTGIGADRVSYAFSVPSSTIQPKYYTYWAKIHLSGSDKFVTDAYMANTGSTLNVCYLDYGHSYLDATNNTSVWKQLSFPMISSGPGAYDSITLAFYMPTALDTSSYVIVDDLAFGQYAAGIDNVTDETVMETIYPNPANELTTMVYSINTVSEVQISVYDLLGNKISTVVNEKQSSGKYKAEINTKEIPNGVYVVNLNTNGQSNTRKLIIQH